MKRSNSLALLLAAQAATACATTVTYEQLDHVSRATRARTILHEKDFSIYSPFDSDHTTSYLELAREEDRSLRTFFEAEPEMSWILILAPTEELGVDYTLRGDQISFSAVRRRRCSGILGMAGGRQAMVYVAAPQELRRDDGSILTGYMDPKTYATAIRHELVHLHTGLAGLTGDPWFQEALAELLEDAPTVDDCLKLDDVETTFARLGQLPSEQWDLARALGLREDL